MQLLKYLAAQKGQEIKCCPVARQIASYQWQPRVRATSQPQQDKTTRSAGRGCSGGLGVSRDVERAEYLFLLLVFWLGQRIRLYQNGKVMHTSKI